MRNDNFLELFNIVEKKEKKQLEKEGKKSISLQRQKDIRDKLTPKIPIVDKFGRLYLVPQ